MLTLVERILNGPPFPTNEEIIAHVHTQGELEFELSLRDGPESHEAIHRWLWKEAPNEPMLFGQLTPLGGGRVRIRFEPFRPDLAGYYPPPRAV